MFSVSRDLVHVKHCLGWELKNVKISPLFLNGSSEHHSKIFLLNQILTMNIVAESKVI